MNYPMYGNNNAQFYMQDLQSMKDRIDAQMRQMQQLQNQQQQQQQIPTNLTQNFQLAPQTNNSELESKYAENISEVKSTFVMKTGLFINKDFNTLWVKNVNGDIRVFALNELIEQDPKDIEIQNLRNELENMKGMIKNANEPANTIVDAQPTSEKSTRISSSKRSNAK